MLIRIMFTDPSFCIGTLSGREQSESSAAREPVSRPAGARRSLTHPGRLLATALAAVMILGTVRGADFGPIYPVWTISVLPFYQARDLVFEPGLLGKWRSPESADATPPLQFEQQGTNGYAVTYIERDSTNLMQALAFKLHGALFLDVFGPEPERTSTLPPPPIPSHMLLRVYQFKPTLRFAAIKSDWIEEFLKKRPTALRHEVILGGTVVLTDETADLQKFVIKILKTEAVWQIPPELRNE